MSDITVELINHSNNASFGTIVFPHGSPIPRIGDRMEIHDGTHRVTFTIDDVVWKLSLSEFKGVTLYLTHEADIR